MKPAPITPKPPSNGNSGIVPPWLQNPDNETVQVARELALDQLVPYVASMCEN